MRDVFLIGFAVFIGVAGAVITALPAVAWCRRFRHRRSLMRAFLLASGDGQLRAKFCREKEIFGDGFIDSFTGTAGVMRFRLSRRFRPFQTVDTYYLDLGHGAADDGSRRASFRFEIGTPEEGGHPVAAAYRELRKKHPMDAPLSEAS